MLIPKLFTILVMILGCDLLVAASCYTQFPWKNFNNEDFDGDLITEMSFYSNGTWRMKTASGVRTYDLGSAGDIPVPHSYRSGYAHDLGVWRPSNGTWYWEYRDPVGFGLSDDKPVPADYDGDCLTDVAVFRQGVWYILQSTNNTIRYEYWGTTGDIPVPGFWGQVDYWTALGVYRPSNSTWYLRGLNTTSQFTEQFGVPGDKPVPGSYDHSGSLNLAVFRPSNRTWYISRLVPNPDLIAIEFGLETDIPVPGAYWGFETSIAVYRPSTGVWYYLDTNFDLTFEVYFPANSGEQPLPGYLYR